MTPQERTARKRLKAARKYCEDMWASAPPLDRYPAAVKRYDRALSALLRVVREETTEAPERISHEDRV